MAEIPFEIDGYIVDELELPYSEKEGRIFYLCEEGINEETHKKIREEKYSELEKILKEKWEESEKEKQNIGLYRASIKWLEKDFTKWLMEELSKKFYEWLNETFQGIFSFEDLIEKIDKAKNWGEQFKEWLKERPYLTGLEYNFIVMEGENSYFIIKNDISVKFINDEQASLIRKYLRECKENITDENKKKLEWVSRNAKKFRELLERSKIHEGNYIVFKNLEKEIAKEIG